jgi:transglutaminase-like putative cysteine protease
MFVKLGYEIVFDLVAPTPMILLLYTYPDRAGWLRTPDLINTDPELPVYEYRDGFGNRCGRIMAPAGRLRLWSEFLAEIERRTNPVFPDAIQHPIEELPADTLQFLLASRYCEVDTLMPTAWELFGHTPPGWARAQAICDWVHNHVRFDYACARPTKTALDVYNEGTGVCRDFQHLAITFCRCLGIPARYATGYLGDHDVPATDGPMDFSAWFEVYLSGEWHTFDARYNTPRVGHVLMARGRDAVDCALTTSFGPADLVKFLVICKEADAPDMMPAG